MKTKTKILFIAILSFFMSNALLSQDEKELNTEKKEREDDSATPRDSTANEVCCGPDVTLQVLKTLDEVKRLYANASESNQDYNCSMKGLGAFDISRLISYKRWSNWRNSNGKICAQKGTPCEYTVQFFGRCYHAAVVNYVLWGVIDELCDLILPYHGAWNIVAYGGSPHYEEQKAMVAFGARYARMKGNAEEFIAYIEKHGQSLLSGLHKNTHKGYGGRCPTNCGVNTVDPQGPWRWYWGRLRGGR